MNFFDTNLICFDIFVLYIYISITIRRSIITDLFEIMSKVDSVGGYFRRTFRVFLVREWQVRICIEIFSASYIIILSYVFCSVGNHLYKLSR